LKSDKKGWISVVGGLVILAACALSYILTKPTEADVASLNKLSAPCAHQIKLEA